MPRIPWRQAALFSLVYAEIQGKGGFEAAMYDEDLDVEDEYFDDD